MKFRRKILFGSGLAFIAAAVMILAHGYAYTPLKFRYLIHRVESARTAAEEKRAFELAAYWGRVFEVDRLSPGSVEVNDRHFTGDWLLRLEWIDSSPYDGGAYAAYRTVIDTNNLTALWRSY